MRINNDIYIINIEKCLRSINVAFQISIHLSISRRKFLSLSKCRYFLAVADIGAISGHVNADECWCFRVLHSRSGRPLPDIFPARMPTLSRVTSFSSCVLRPTREISIHACVADVLVLDRKDRETRMTVQRGNEIRSHGAEDRPETIWSRIFNMPAMTLISDPHRVK